MAPLPHNNTDIVYVDYQQGPRAHTFQVRVADVGNVASWESDITDLLDLTNSLIYAATITATRGQNSGSSISFPVPSTLVGTSFGTGTINAETVPFNLDFIGRSAGGRRVRLDIFGLKLGLSDYRLTAAENSDVAAMVAVLQGATDSFYAIDGTKAIWYPYADTGVNAYWQKKQRA